MSKIRKKLDYITDEVNQLHPLLGKLFANLPDIHHVEYTHGTDEMGADFVLERLNPTLSVTEHIGVIAKVGKVVQDFSEISKQIDECSIPRVIRGGKKKINIDEIWVVITKHITSGAKEKIHHKYPSCKITFLEGKKIADLMDKHAPSLWTDLPIETSEYLAELKTKNLEIDKSLSLIQLDDDLFYVEPDIYEYENLDYSTPRKVKRKKELKVDILNIIEEKSLILIEGRMGAGKSKLVRHLIDYYAQPDVFKEKRLLPITISYKDLIDRHDGNITDFIDEEVGSKILEEVADSKMLIFIDGVDEKNMELEHQYKEMESLVEAMETTENAVVVVTSRYIEGFEHAGELEKKLSRYEIRPLSFAKLIKFLNKLCKGLNLTDRILEDLKRSQLFKELPRTPISAILLARLLNESTQELPSNMTELYSKYTEYMLGRWDIEKGLQSQKEYQALDNILQNISRFMLDNELTKISLGEAKQFFDQYLKDRNLNIESEELFIAMQRRCEVVLINIKHNTFMFKHKTFMEFFYAKSMLRDASITIDNKIYTLYWMNVYFFMLGLKKDCPDILEQIINLEPNFEPEKWIRMVNMPNFLLAAFTSPYEIITSGILKASIEAGRLFNDIAEGEIESPFALLPRMHLLYFMQMLIRENYSYDFFRKAIEDSALIVIDSDEPSTVKAYTLFFLNVTHIELGASESFDFMLEEFKENIPIDIQLALRHEGNNLSQRTALMKKQDRAIRKALKNNQLLKNTVSDMYDKPLSSTVFKK